MHPAPPIVVRLPWRHPERTRGLVVGLAHVWARHPASRPLAAAVGRTLPEAFAFWRDAVRFAPELGEVIQTPGVTIRRRAGDCDDKTLGVLWWSQVMGRDARAMLLAHHPDDRDELRGVAPGEPLGQWRAFHIWPQVRERGGWLDVETCDPRCALGEHPADFMRRVGVRL